MLVSSQLEKIHDHLRKTEAEIRGTQAMDANQAKRTNRFIHVLLTVVAMVALVNLYFVGDLAQEIQVLIRDMTKTYVHFGEMTDRMSQMTHHVHQMSESVGFMPVVVQQLGAMSADMFTMEEQVAGIRQLMDSMSFNVNSVNRDITAMSAVFRDVNGKLVHIRYNVRQMSDVVP